MQPGGTPPAELVGHMPHPTPPEDPLDRSIRLADEQLEASKLAMVEAMKKAKVAKAHYGKDFTECEKAKKAKDAAYELALARVSRCEVCGSTPQGKGKGEKGKGKKGGKGKPPPPPPPP